MPNTKEIQNRIRSIQDTRKITNAMYMISSTKLKKARKSLEQTEPYFYALQRVISRVLRHLPQEVHSSYFHARFEERAVAEPGAVPRRGLVVLSGDKGLAGSFNHDIFKAATAWLREPGDNKLFVIGEVGRQYFVSKGIPVEMEFRYTAQDPTMSRARSIAGVLIEKFLHGDLDEISVIYTNMETSITETVETVQLLPLKRADFGGLQIPGDVFMEDFQMLPSPKAVLDAIIPNYVKGFLYGTLVESFCSEQNARMLAMQNATDSADDMLRRLSIAYNRARQAAITQEITEVSSGAKAQRKKRLEQQKKKQQERV